MAIPGQANINIGAENQVAGSDTLFDAFHTIQNNFTQLFETSSPFDTFRAGDGVTVSSNVSNGVVSVTNTGVTKITAGSGITVSGANGNVTISTIPQGPAGVIRVGLTSNSLSVTGGNIVSQGNFTVDLPRIQTGEHFATGEYIAPTLTVDGFGRITSIANGVGVGTVTSVGLTPGKGISVTGGPIIDSGAITVENTGVTSVQAGKGIQVSSTNGDITISATNDGTGSVAYVGLTSNNLTITGGPVTSVGNFTVDLPSSFVSNLYSNADAANYIPTYTGNLNPNNVSASNNITANGNITANNITATNVLHANVVSANTFTGTFSGNATTAGTVTTNAQPNITSTGNLTSLVVTGAANVGGNLNVTGNVIISGNTTSYIANSTYGAVQSGFEIGSDGYILFRAINGSGNYVAFVPPTSVSVAGLSWQLPNTIGNASQVLVSDGGPLYWRSPPAAGTNSQVQFNDAGNANGSTSLTFNKSTGTLAVGNLNVTGNATSTNVFATTQMTAPRFISNVAVGTAPFTVTSTTQVANLNAALAGTVVTNAQPNITSTGTLTGLSVTGNVAFSGANVSLGAVGNVKVTGGTSGQFLRTDGTGNLSWVTASGFDGSQVITISNTTDATSPSTGALKVSGGVGVTGNVYAGNLSTPGTLYVGMPITGNSSISIKGITNQGTIYSSGNITSDSFVEGVYLKADTSLAVWGSNASTSTTTGAATILGGLGVGGNINAGGDVTATGNVTANNFVTSGSSGNISGANYISANYFKATPTTVTSLPAAATAGAGARTFVTNSSLAASGNFGATVSGGGSNTVPVYSDGSSWRIG